MVVSEKIIYPNLTGEDLDQLALVIESSRTRGVFKLYQFAWGDMDGEEIESYTLADGLLLLPLRETLHPGEAIELFLVYSLTLPKQPGPFGYTGRQTNLTDWYAFVPPYTAQRHWVYSPPGKVGEHLVYETADFFVDIMIDDEDYRLAGPTATEETQDGYRYYLREARAFSWSASKETLVFEYDQGGIPVSIHVFPEHRRAGEAALIVAGQALEAFEEKFGPYPYQTLTLVEIDFGDGLESDGLFFIGEGFFEEFDGTVKNLFSILIAHETAHQWWYGQVGSHQALEPWVDEALATYSELLFYEYHYPGSAAWWWEFRVEKYALFEKVGGSIFQYQLFPNYVRGEYLQGAKFLQALREQIGDDAFFAALHEYLAAGTHKIMKGEDLLRIFAAHSDVDITPLIEAYFLK